MTEAWFEILIKQVEAKGQAAVAREIGLSRATVSQVLGGKYAASTDRIEAKVEAIYGRGGLVECPVLGDITVADCAENYSLARQYGNQATGNPETLRLYVFCRKRCPVRRQ